MAWRDDVPGHDAPSKVWNAVKDNREWVLLRYYYKQEEAERWDDGRLVKEAVYNDSPHALKWLVGHGRREEILRSLNLIWDWVVWWQREQCAYWLIRYGFPPESPDALAWCSQCGLL